METIPSLFAEMARDAVSGIVYGVGTTIPNVEISLEDAKKLEYPGWLMQTDADEIDLVSSRLLFRDGTSSDVRISGKGFMGNDTLAMKFKIPNSS